MKSSTWQQMNAKGSIAYIHSGVLSKKEKKYCNWQGNGEYGEHCAELTESDTEREESYISSVCEIKEINQNRGH